MPSIQSLHSFVPKGPSRSTFLTLQAEQVAVALGLSYRGAQLLQPFSCFLEKSLRPRPSRVKCRGKDTLARSPHGSGATEAAGVATKGRASI